MKLLKRFYQAVCIVSLTTSITYTMIMDNRYFPWLPHVYTGTDSKHGNLYVEPFFITSSTALKVGPGTKDRDVGYPVLQGALDYSYLAQAFELDGMPNPIPAQWQYLATMPVDMPGSFQGQGLSIAGYSPIYDHIGIGGSIFFLRFIGQANIVPTADLIRQLNLTAPGNMAQFNQLTATFEQMAGTKDGYWNQTGVSDLEVYIKLFQVYEYMYWCKKIDCNGSIGFFIPTGMQQQQNFIGSVPFGGDGMWGWYLAPSIEIELKEDWKIGLQIRAEKRFGKTQEQRICIAKETNLFAPVTGPLYTNPGPVAVVMPYISLENIREGLGISFKYSYIYHAQDKLKDMRVVKSPAANLENMIKNSRWSQEFATLELLYDLSFKHNWTYKPLCSLTWDIPLQVLGSRGVSKTTRVSVGLMMDF